MTTKSARAACLSGDIRPECIGIYKLPIDAAESPFIETPERLKAYAPDVQWVPPVEYPRGYADAVRQLKDQRGRVDAAKDLVATGNIEGAGLLFLDIAPKVASSGIVIAKSFGKASSDERNLAMKKASRSPGDAAVVGGGSDGNPSSTNRAVSLEMKAYRIQEALNELTGCLGQTDILIGQGLRGQLGVSAPAQIEILAEISECAREFDNLLGTVPEKMPSY